MNHLIGAIKTLYELQRDSTNHTTLSILMKAKPYIITTLKRDVPSLNIERVSKRT